jgi:hypothetical protein
VRSKLRLSATLVATIFLGVLLFGPSIANARDGGKRVLKLTATELQSEFLDLGTTGPSLGDELVFSETLFRGYREVGTSGVVCTVTHVVPPYDVTMFQCVGTLSLRHGQITLQGLIEVQGEDDPGPFTVAITGGTGAYRGAGGEAKVREVSPGTNVYKLRFDSRKKDHSK